MSIISANWDADYAENKVQLLQSSQDVAKCGCPEQVVLQNNSEAVFRDLNHEEFYFLIVARTYAQAFFGLALLALQLQALELNPPNRIEDYNKLYGASSADRDDKDIGTPL